MKEEAASLRLHGVAIQKIAAVVRTSNLTILFLEYGIPNEVQRIKYPKA
jgi:hypothetical protein